MDDVTFARALQVMAGTPPVLRALVENLPPGSADLRPNEASWSPAEVLAHLLHSETVGIARRVRGIVEQDQLPFVRTAPTPPPGEPREMLEAWTSARSENLAWLPTLSAEQRQHVQLHPRFGAISVDILIAEWAYHDLDHIRQICGALSAELYPHIGTYQSLYAPPA